MRATIVASLVAAGGLVLVGLAAWWPWLQEDAQSWLRNVLSQIGSLVLVSGAVALYWDLRGKRDMIDEVLVRVRTSEEMKAAGISGVTTDYRSIPWDDYLKGSTSFDLFIAYGQTWRNSNWAQLQAFAADPKRTMRVFLPDPNDDATVAILAQRFAYTPEKVRSRIEEMATEMATLLEPRGADVRVYYRAGDPTYTLYKFDRVAVVTVYSNSRQRGDVPALTVTQGSLLSFFEAEIEAIERQSVPVNLADLIGGEK
jgi:hypothetical protein